MGFSSVEQTFGSGFPNQERRPFSLNSGLLNTLWWSGLGMTAVIIGVAVFILLLQSPDEPQDFTTKVVPFEPVFQEYVKQPPNPTETIPSSYNHYLVLDIPETLSQVPEIPKFSTHKKEETENERINSEVKSKPLAKISPDKKRLPPL